MKASVMVTCYSTAAYFTTVPPNTMIDVVSAAQSVPYQNVYIRSSWIILAANPCCK